MPGFRYEIKHDLALATEVASARPNKPTEWDTIAAKLSEQFSSEDKPAALKGRGCRERLELLLKKYQDDDKKALKKSGTEEEFSDLSQLLEDISTYMRDFATVRLEGKKKEAQKKEDDRKKGKEMCQAAMETIARRMSSPTIELEDNDFDYSSVDSAPQSKKMKLAHSSMKRIGKLSVVELLKEKYKRNVRIREKELELKEKELELQERKLALKEESQRRLKLDEERQRAEKEERQRAEAEERKALFELLMKKV